jgi:hypothetical protein
MHVIFLPVKQNFALLILLYINNLKTINSTFK